jgi:hypothetical protein
LETTTLPSEQVSADEFQALEQKVLRAVEIVRREREARAAAEVEAASLATRELTVMNQERETVRQRVEKMLEQMDELL